MGSESVHAHSDRTNSVLVALASPRRRVALAALVDESESLTVRTLATRVAAGHDTSSADVAVADRDRAHVALVHCELPKLAEAGLVEWDRDAGTVSAADHPALANSRLRRVLEAPKAEWDDVLECLAHDRRRVVLSVLVDHGGAIARRNLARRTVARERDVSRSSVSPDDVDEALASLYHVHLPKLRDAGLVVDDGLETVRYADHPDLDEESLTLDASQGAAPMALATQ